MSNNYCLMYLYSCLHLKWNICKYGWEHELRATLSVISSYTSSHWCQYFVDNSLQIKGSTSRFAHWKVTLKSLKFFKFVVWNLCQSHPYSISLLFMITCSSLVFFYLLANKLLFSGFLQFKGNFVHGQRD